MDKSKWEYKKLGEVCTMYQPKTISTQELVDAGAYLVYGANGVIGKYDKYNHEQSEILMTCRGATCGTINISEPFSWINGNAMVIHPTNNDYVRDFLVYQLKAVDKSSVITGAAQPQITRQMLQTLPVVLAPIEDQQRIVAELNCLNEMIAVKQEQLKEFDKLAQSIFYDMFGDPVSNDKEWETYKLEELGVLARGVSKHRPRNAPELLGGTMPLIQTGDVANAEMYITSYTSTYSDLGIAQSKVWDAGTLCITIAATIGKCAILSFKACFPDSVVGFMAERSKTNNVYMYFIFKRLQKILEMNAPAVAQKNINLAVLNALQIPLPPLSLQQQFADKISAIEAQKELVKQSIAETQTLLDYTMDYYFN